MYIFILYIYIYYEIYIYIYLQEHMKVSKVDNYCDKIYHIHDKTFQFIFVSREILLK